MTSDATSGLRGRLTRFLHWELNVRDLSSSIAFFEALTSFRASAPATEPGRRTSLLVNGPGLPEIPRLNLVEWLDPAPLGSPHDSLAASGFVRLVFHVADLDAARATAERLGFSPVAPTTGDDFRFVLGSRGSTAYRAWVCLDPDGTVVEFLQNAAPKLSTVAQGTASLARGRGFALDVLGLDQVDTVATPGPVPNVYLLGGPPVEFTGAFFRVPGDDRGYLDVLEHTDRSLHRPAYGPANHVGVIHCAFEVDDVWAAAGILNDLGVPVDGEPVERTFGEPLGRRHVLTFRDPDGVRFELVQGGT